MFRVEGLPCKLITVTNKNMQQRQIHRIRVSALHLRCYKSLPLLQAKIMLSKKANVYKMLAAQSPVVPVLSSSDAFASLMQ